MEWNTMNTNSQISLRPHQSWLFNLRSFMLLVPLWRQYLSNIKQLVWTFDAEVSHKSIRAHKMSRFYNEPNKRLLKSLNRKSTIPQRTSSARDVKVVISGKNRHWSYWAFYFWCEMILVCILLLICVKSAFVSSGSFDPFVTSDTLQAGGLAMITSSAFWEQRGVATHLLRVQSRCFSLFPWRHLILDDSSWRWMIWSRDEARCIVPAPATVELSRRLLLAAPLMDFQSQQRPKPWSGPLEQNAFHTDAEPLRLAHSFLPAVVSNLWTLFLAAQHMWAHADIHIVSANDRMQRILVLTWGLLLLSLPEKDPDGPSRHWILSKKLFFPPLVSFLMQQKAAFLLWIGRRVYLLYVFKSLIVGKSDFLSIKKTYISPPTSRWC